MRNLDDMILLVGFFNYYGMDATAIPSLDVSTWNDFLVMAQEQKRRFDLDKQLAVKDEMEIEEDEEARLKRKRKEFEEVLFHSSG
jgi:hypothetical protein